VPSLGTAYTTWIWSPPTTSGRSFALGAPPHQVSGVTACAAGANEATRAAAMTARPTGGQVGPRRGPLSYGASLPEKSPPPDRTGRDHGPTCAEYGPFGGCRFPQRSPQAILQLGKSGGGC
jgi:hypothetical protein